MVERLPPVRGPLRVLGLDPGTRKLGWAVVERVGPKLEAIAHGTLVADPKAPLPDRLLHIAGGLRDAIREHAPREAAIEETFQGRGPQAALRLGEGRGAALLVVAEAGLPVAGYANNVVKRAVTGAGRAAKESVRDMVVRLLDLPEPPAGLDASDALAVAICHLQRGGLGATGAGGVSPRVADAVRRAKAADRSRSRRSGGRP